MQQPAPSINEIAVAYPSQHEWRLAEEMVRNYRTKRFLSHPPEPRVMFDELTMLQQKFVEVAIDGKHQVMYLLGRAGSGKTEVLLHICSRMKGRVQIGATTGKAASYFNGPTVHGMFGISLQDFSEGSVRLDAGSKKCRENAMMYEDVELFIIDECGMMPANMLGLLDEIMTLSFNPERKKTKGEVPPFGGKRMLFVGDQAQLPPVEGDPFYITSKSLSSQRSSLKKSRALRGQAIYRSYMRANVTVFEKCHRNAGLLAEIADALREGTQTQEHLNRLELQLRRFPEADADRGIHYSNEVAMSYNWRSLWKWCKTTDRRLWVAKASYHEADNNQFIVDVLSTLPAKVYNYAPHLLCISVGCEVSLLCLFVCGFITAHHQAFYCQM